MLSMVTKGLRYGASFLLSSFSADTWMLMIVGAIGTALLALMVAGFFMHAAVASTSILIAAGVLALFTVPLALGIYSLNKDSFKNSSANTPDTTTEDSSWTLAYLSTFGQLS